MYRVFKNIEDYSAYTNNGQKLTSGDVYIVTDDKKVILQTNNIDGEFAVYDMIEPTGNISITENGEDINVAPYSTATVNVESGNPLFSQYIDGSLTTIDIPEGTTKIGDCAFYYCTGLTSINIPDSVTSIGNGAFFYCDGITSITIPDSVTNIGNIAFYNCSGLDSMTIEATTPPTLSHVNAFDNTNNCPIYVPSESVSAYKAATNWSSLSSRIQAIPA